MFTILAKLINYAIITIVKNKISFKNLLKMFLTFLKLGFLSIGGGNTMISMLEGELVDKKKWITAEELIEMIAVAEVTPGPIAINIATYIGYKKGKVLGALMTTLGIIIPPVICMFLVATFLEKLVQFKFIEYALLGIKCGVIFLLGTIVISLVKRTKVDIIGFFGIILVVAAEIVLDILKIEFSAIYFILLGAALGIVIYGLIPKFKKKENKK